MDEDTRKRLAERAAEHARRICFQVESVRDHAAKIGTDAVAVTVGGALRGSTPEDALRALELVDAILTRATSPRVRRYTKTADDAVEHFAEQVHLHAVWAAADLAEDAALSATKASEKLIVQLRPELLPQHRHLADEPAFVTQFVKTVQALAKPRGTNRTRQQTPPGKEALFALLSIHFAAHLPKSPRLWEDYDTFKESKKFGL